MSLANASQPNITSSGPRETTIFDRSLGALQSLGRALMLPIAVLPAAGLLLRLGQPDVLNWTWMADGGNAIFSHLPFIFAVGIVIGLTGGEAASALAAVVGFFVFDAVFGAIIPQVNGAPDPNISMGVLEGILVGVVTAILYNRFYKIRLPDYLGFFGGRRFVPIITAVVMLVLGALFGLIWPPIQNVVNAGGNGLIGLGPLGAGIYGFLNRLLIPIGLHHVLNTYIWYQLGTFTSHGTVFHGDITRFVEGDPTAGKYEAGFYPIMMFGLPAACLAMIRHAHFPKVAAGILLSAAFASFLTGITEPIEYAFVFVAPLLYVIHAVLTGTALAICYILNIHLAFSFSAGLIDYILYFDKGQNVLLLLPIGLVYGVIYYFVFSFCITRFNLGTPGRGEASTGLAADWILPESQRGPKNAADTSATTPVAESDGNTATATATAVKPTVEEADLALATNILEALGGKENVQSVEGCITRLRLFVNDTDKIDDARLKGLGASGVLKRGKIAQVVMGTRSDSIADDIKQLLK